MTYRQWIGDFLQHKTLLTFPGEGKYPPAQACGHPWFRSWDEKSSSLRMAKNEEPSSDLVVMSPQLCRIRIVINSNTVTRENTLQQIYFW